MKLFKKLFPCKFNNPLCKDNPLGCRCGVIGTTAAIIAAGVAMTAGVVGAAAISSSAQRRAAASAEELAREQQNAALAEQQRLEEKYGLTPGELAREQRLYGLAEGEQPIQISEGLEARQQTELERRAGMSGEELLREVGPETRALLDQIAARQGMTGEELFRQEGAIPEELANQILADVQAPGARYEDTLNQQLELARTMVNAEANRRGVFGGLPEGGIRFENLGRAGVDLAIQSASGRQAARQQDLSNASTLATLFQNLSTGARSEAGTVGERALTEQTGARSELQNFLQLMENASAASRGRAAQVATGASQVAQQTQRDVYGNLIGLEGYRGTIQSPAEAGLSAIGQMGASYLGNLPTPTTSVPTTTPTPSTLENLRGNQFQYDPYQELEQFYATRRRETGSWLGQDRR